MTPMIGVSWDVELDPDKAVHIMHITVGTSTVHLVGKESVMSSGTGKKYTPSPRQIGRASEKGTSDQGGGDEFT